MSRALVPRSMMSSLVSTPMVRSPSGSTVLAMRMASEVAMSALAGDTASMMTLSPFTKSITMLSMSWTMLLGCPSMGILVSPGMSTRVSVGTFFECTVNWMGSGETALLGPSDLLVSSSISSLTASKSWNTSPLRWRNSARSFPPSVLMSWSTSGLRVTIPDPLGKKSRPTTLSRTLLFPLLCPPITTTCGSAFHKLGKDPSPPEDALSPSRLHALCNRFTNATS
mmetsp:Transcript_4795/g.30409  ORF Transcript_4795/g.30409 Transcript_4795/m.30409 type:complete len:225 (-) Transcript_4795:253-927(-)